ncbi:uncharacterized protein LOC133845404 [Drosophila sulfurigaster albostrigata]|uniref:uncharacterized protein LOC133845404 n=1 Tax=Drosophila sulfurigaster albostrigata TaxID=89887 RepID=UPI002D21CA36|nr:uncharacterized protein LOC133845404 [Drosophila sulfurigaster albostrigata]
MMRSVNSLLLATSRRGMIREMSVQSHRASKRWTATGLGKQQYRFMQDANQMRKTSTLQSMKEFFMHPLTWDRNNGFLNVVLALAIFSFCFINSCSKCPEEGAQMTSKTAADKD